MPDTVDSQDALDDVIADRELTYADAELVALKTVVAFFKQKIPDDRKKRRETGQNHVNDRSTNEYIGVERAEIARKFLQDRQKFELARTKGTSSARPCRTGTVGKQTGSLSGRTQAAVEALRSSS